MIQCKDSKGVEYKTPEMKFNSHSSTVQNHILNSIPFLTERVEVINIKKYAYLENGVEMLLYFRGL